MATPADIETVRANTNEADTATSSYSDETIGALVDAYGLDSAVAKIWERKAASYSELVDVSEAGASRKFGDLYKNAIAMAKVYNDKAAAAGDSAVSPSSRPRIHRLER